LCELQALLSVASALRSVHRRHHWVKVNSFVENSALLARVPKSVA
jgi:hypothetical protein